MEKHYGEIIEMVIRRNGYSISELARSLRLNRRSIYNWFSRPKLRVEIIFNLGCALRYDFSREFPELFSSEDFSKALYKDKLNGITFFTKEEERANYWRNKYVNMLEEYNQMLLTVETDSNLRYS